MSPNTPDNSKLFVASPEAFDAATGAPTRAPVKPRAGYGTTPAPRLLDVDDCVLHFQVAIESAFESAQIELANAVAVQSGALHSAFNLDPSPFRASGVEQCGLRASALWHAMLEAEPGFAARVESAEISFSDVWSECVARSQSRSQSQSKSQGRASEASDSSNIG